ncbi:hypothetical protein BOTBODRAFT_37355 [Botryobasidium botryosum FD-172 SS1]|uniref:Protein kinase domain-containing protein n=1 Tax=Botryobasidium botryosum (strain FD-172 SS1) TaxID=930990 RepID=A0A067MB53_BOTB1|nr:hypothetical protein BOTBODRAFT_37355 [Botryobasidium botryosum FD-172 SS1]
MQVDAGANLNLLDRHVGANMRRFLAHVLRHPDSTADVDYLTVGVDAKGTDLQGHTYLDRAVWLGSPSAVKALLHRDASPNGRGLGGRMPLHYAFNLMQHPDGAGAIQALVDAGANVNATADSDGNTPLHIAVSRACPPAFRIMFARGEAPKAKYCFSDRFLDAPGGTDLMISLIEDGRLECDFADGYDSILCHAIQRGSLAAIRRLMDGLDIPDDQWDTHFRYLTELIGHPGGKQGSLALTEEGGLIDATNKDDASLLRLAVTKPSCRAVQFLLRQGAYLRAGGTLRAVPPQSVVKMLEDPDGISTVLQLVRAGMTVNNASRYHMKIRSRPSCFKLIGELRKLLEMDLPSVHSACINFLSTFYPLLECYPSDSPLHELEIEPMKMEKSEQGGFSDCCEGIFLGRHKVAMKALRAHVVGGEVAARRMQREVNVWRKLNHPNVLPFIGWCILESKAYMISPWMENGDALTYVKKRPQANRLQLLAQVAEGLDYLHTGPKNPVIHGDLKAANVLISSAGVARIADFGLSELVEGEKAPRCSTAWYCGGNPRWQAPELLNASTNEEARRTKETDCFAYGRVMLEIFTGQVPFFYLSTNTLSIFNMVRNGQFPDRPLGKDIVAKGLDDRVWELMKTCWSMDPTQRLSAAEILKRLEDALRRHCDDDSNSEGSANPRPEKRARVVVKVEEVDA